MYIYDEGEEDDENQRRDTGHMCVFIKEDSVELRPLDHSKRKKSLLYFLKYFLKINLYSFIQEK